MKIIMSTPGHGDAHGCPYKHWSEDGVRAALRKMSLSSKVVDEVWHAHILDTRAYTAACEAMLGAGGLIHHDPHGGDDAAARDARLRRTVRACRSTARCTTRTTRTLSALMPCATFTCTAMVVCTWTSTLPVFARSRSYRSRRAASRWASRRANTLEGGFGAHGWTTASAVGAEFAGEVSTAHQAFADLYESGGKR